jgi:hypothetical protein
MEEPESRNSFDIPHDFFKVCDFTIPKRASMQGMVFLQKKEKADFCKTTLKLLFAIKI